ncbi:transglutaminase-like putative cysteine protease [Lysobacter sp. OAE881]|uniref:DUF3857 domain-containing transglutaminase family protein n=1 Tax=Lysobacter sp. OAE881 TaxID=2663813 RepID=UPI00178B4E61
MGKWWGLLAWMLAGAACAADAQHERGEYRFTVGPEPAFVEVGQPADRWDSTAPGADGAPWRFWRYDMQVDNRRGRDAYYVDYVYEPRSATLLGEAGRFQISFNPEYQQLKIHRVELRRDGRWLSRLAPERISLARRETDFEQDLADGQVTALIVLEDIRVEDVVRVSYTVTGSNPVLAGSQSTTMPMGWRSPALDMNFRALFDPGASVAVRTEGDAPVPQVQTFADRVEASTKAHAVPAYVDEGDYPRWYRFYPRVQVASRRSWADVVAWALPLYPAVGTLSPELEAQIARWRTLGSDEARLKAALRTVQQQVRYFGVEMGENTHRPTPPSETWARRYGDCKDKAYLLSTMLARLGIRAEPALVSMERGQAVADYLPSASAFDHVIVRARLGKTTVWVDPTLTSEGGDPSQSDQSAYAYALPIARDVVALQPILRPPSAVNGVSVQEHYQPAADGRESMLEVRTLYQGDSANGIRRSIAHQRMEEVSRRYADYYRQRFGDIEVVQSSTVQDDLDANRLTTVERYRLLAPFEAQGGNRVLDLVAESLLRLTNPPSTVERTGPLYLSAPARYSHRIQMDIPSQWRPMFSDDHQQFSTAAFDYRRDVRVGDAKVDVAYEMDLLQPEVAASQAAGYVQQLRKAREGLSAQLRFQVPGPLQRQDRDARLKALLRDVIDEGASP